MSKVASIMTEVATTSLAMTYKKEEMMPNIYLLILNYKLKDVILACLASVEKLDTSTFSLTTVVIDNNSSDVIEEALKEKFPQVKFIQTGDNLGYAGGNNVGIKYALDHGADYVVVLNPDVTVDPNLLLELLAGFVNDKVGITVPKIYFAAGYEFHKDRYKEDERGNVIWYAGATMDWSNIIGSHIGVDQVDKGQFDQPGEVELLTGNCFMIKRQVLETVGLLDERYFMYYEDADYAMRLKKAGFTIRYVPKANLWHLNGQSAGGSGSPLQDYFITRNRLLFGFTYGSTRAKIALLREAMRGAMQYKTRRLALTDFVRRKYGKGSYIKA